MYRQYRNEYLNIYLGKHFDLTNPCCRLGHFGHFFPQHSSRLNFHWVAKYVAHPKCSFGRCFHRPKFENNPNLPALVRWQRISTCPVPFETTIANKCEIVYFQKTHTHFIRACMYVLNTKMCEYASYLMHYIEILGQILVLTCLPICFVAHQ